LSLPTRENRATLIECNAREYKERRETNQGQRDILTQQQKDNTREQQHNVYQI
jgi:hypothetical protein